MNMPLEVLVAKRMQETMLKILQNHLHEKSPECAKMAEVVMNEMISISPTNMVKLVEAELHDIPTEIIEAILDLHPEMEIEETHQGTIVSRDEEHVVVNVPQDTFDVEYSVDERNISEPRCDLAVGQAVLIIIGKMAGESHIWIQGRKWNASQIIHIDIMANRLLKRVKVAPHVDHVVNG